VVFWNCDGRSETPLSNEMKRVKYYIMNHLLYAKLQIPLARPEKRGRRILEPSPHHQMRERERETTWICMFL